MVDKVLIQITQTNYTADAYVFDTVDGSFISEYTLFTTYSGVIQDTNTGSSVTLKIGDGAVKSVKAQDGVANLSASDLTAGQIVFFVYDGTNFRLNANGNYGNITTNTITATNYIGLPGDQNLIINPQGSVAQRGDTFTSVTSPANSDDTYLLDRWVLLSDGNNIVDVSREFTEAPSGSYSAIKYDVETANKKFGQLQIVESKDCSPVVGGVASLSFKAKKVVGNATLDKLRAAVISWDGTPDVVTSDVVSAWGAEGVDPTLVANWTYENTPSDLTLTDSYQTFKIENISIDTASTQNVAVFIWCDNTDPTVGDLVYITDVKLESGATSSAFSPRPFSQELDMCKRFFSIVQPTTGGGLPGGTSIGVPFTLHPEMRLQPTLSVRGTLVYTNLSTDFTQSSGQITVLSSNTRGGYATIGNFTGIALAAIYVPRNPIPGEILANIEL